MGYMPVVARNCAVRWGRHQTPQHTFMEKQC